MRFENLRIKETDIVVRFTPDAMNFTSTSKKHHIVGIQISGKAEHIFADKSFVMGESCVYFLNQTDDYSVKVLEKGVAFSVHFKTYEPIETDSFCVKINNPRKIIGLLERIERLYLSASDELSLMSKVYDLCSEISLARSRRYHHSDERIFRSAEYMKTHFSSVDCLASAAQLCRVSRRHFNTLFKKHYETTPNKYLTDLRIAHAKKLLSADGLSVTQIAEMCGFSDVYYFSAVFKKETGFSPTKYPF